MAPSIRMTAITKKVSVVNIALPATTHCKTSLNFYTLGNASSPHSFGDDPANIAGRLPSLASPCR